jgi:hypothetical protein
MTSIELFVILNGNFEASIVVSKSRQFAVYFYLLKKFLPVPNFNALHHHQWDFVYRFAGATAIVRTQKVVSPF